MSAPKRQENWGKYTVRALKAIMHDFEARDFSIVQGGGGRNNCFIVTDDNAAISENNRFKNGRLLF
jgi:hypothetical protein